MKVRVQNWGNGLALRIPKSVAEQAGLRVGSDLSLSVRDGALVLRLMVRRKYRLAELLRKVTTGNMPVSNDTGDSVGRESW